MNRGSVAGTSNLVVTMLLRLDPDAPLGGGLDWRPWVGLGSDANVLMVGAAAAAWVSRRLEVESG